MKKKIIGLGLLVVIMIVIGVVYTVKTNQPEIVQGYLGGEKIGLFEDEEVQKILKDDYHIQADYSKAGSFDMMIASLDGKDYLFPSSSSALEYYENLYGKPNQSEIIFNTPIVLYTHKNVLEGLKKQGLISTENDVNYIDMAKFISIIESDKKWSDIGVPELYGKVSVDTTDPTKSNSGNMFAALIANVLNNGEIISEDKMTEILPKLKYIFSKLGYMETSSADLFSQFLKMGVGAKPMIAGYENQLIEYAVEQPDKYKKIQDDIVILYPTPTVWSTHMMIALDDSGKTLINALSDEKIQKLAWQNHGFRTGNFEAATDAESIGVKGIVNTVNKVTQPASYNVMEQIIEGLK